MTVLVIPGLLLVGAVASYAGGGRMAGLTAHLLVAAVAIMALTGAPLVPVVWGWSDLSVTLGVSNMSLTWVVLTGIVGAIASTLAREEDGGFHGALLLASAASTITFLAEDAIAFLIGFEAMLLPAAALIARGVNAREAAIRFFVYSQVGGLLLMLAAAGIAADTRLTTGSWSFSFDTWTTQSPLAPVWLTLVLVAFAIKLPVFPLSSWMPDSYTRAPAGATILLSGVLSKTAAYGLLRFSGAFGSLWTDVGVWVAGAAAVAVWVAAALAWSQTDAKRMAAWVSASHLAVVMVGVFGGTSTAAAGVVILGCAHGLSSAGLFGMIEAIERRTGTRNLNELGGFAASAPFLAGVGLVIALASLGLPGLGNFAGEFLLLSGSFDAVPVAVIVAQVAVVAATLYALRWWHRTFLGKELKPVQDADFRERVGFSVVVLGSLMIGLGTSWLLEPLAENLAVIAAEEGR